MFSLLFGKNYGRFEIIFFCNGGLGIIFLNCRTLIKNLMLGS